MKWGKIEKEIVVNLINLINLINVFITQNLMIWNTSEENHNIISGSCAWKTRSHFPVENTELENWKLESVTKFRFPRPILSFPVSVCYVTSFSNWKTGKLEKLEKCKQSFSGARTYVL